MKALGPTLDFAAAKHMDLESAATLVGKAVDGNTGIMKRYGVDVEVAKDAADKMTPVLAALNDQFGGAAQAAASTYAGIQERLKNATGEVSEKIGNMFLPALASLTEGMIPVVDSLGKGIDSISAWLTEVSKMPEVKAVTDAVGGAFEGLGKWFEDVGRTAVEMLGPALQDLWDALREIWDALQPLFEAFGELWSVFAEGEGSGNAFKDVLGIVVVGIRAIATIIKEVAPYIRAFAEAFKAAAEFITPILAQIKTAVEGFLSALRTAFEGFYNWLVGGSLWMDMWNALLSIASQMIGTLLGDLGTKLFEPIKTAFTELMGAVEGLWSQGWQMLQADLSTFGTAAQGVMSEIMTQLQTAVQGGLDAIKAGWNTFVSGLQSGITTLQNALGSASTAITNVLSGIQAATKPATDTIIGAFNNAFNTISSAASGFWNWLVGGSLWPEMLTSMENMTVETFTAILSTMLAGFSAAVSQAQNALSQLANMQAQAQSMAASVAAASVTTLQPGWRWTAEAQRSIQETGYPDVFSRLFAEAARGLPGASEALYAYWFQQLGGKQALGYQTAPGEIKTVQETGPIFAHEGEVIGRPSFPSSITLQNQVIVDGTTVARTVERRMISQRQIAGV
jgi:hypothetical protein